MKWTKEKLERRIRHKNNAVWIVALTWTIISGIFFYLCYLTINPLGLFTILSLITFVIYVIVGFTLKVPELLFRNVFFYPFGIIVAQTLNQISSRWNYTIEMNIIGFGISNWIALLLLYVASSVSAFILLRLTTGYEITLPNPISSFSYYLKSSEENPIELLKSRIKLFENVSLKIVKQKELTWMKFKIRPNRYTIVFVPKNKNEYEVNLFTYQMRSDTLCEADKEEADTIVSIINTLFTTWRKQEHIDQWQTENTPKRSEELKEALAEGYISRAEIPLKIPSLRQIRYDAVDSLKRNKKQIATIIATATITSLIAYLITLLLGS